MQVTGEDSFTAPKTPIDDLLGNQTDLPESYPIENPSTGIGGSSGGGSGTDDPDPPSPTPTPLPGTAQIPGTDSDIQWYERFPFCIPWDVYRGVSALKAKTKVPKFEIPFKIERLGVDETITVDFSEYDDLAAICRWFFRLSFVVGLAMLSRAIIKG